MNRTTGGVPDRKIRSNHSALDAAHVPDAVSRRGGQAVTSAMMGDYGVMVQLGHTSRNVKSPACTGLASDFVTILKATRRGR